MLPAARGCVQIVLHGTRFARGKADGGCFVQPAARRVVLLQAKRAPRLGDQARPEILHRGREAGVARVQAAQSQQVVLGAVVGRFDEPILLQALRGRSSAAEPTHRCPLRGARRRASLAQPRCWSQPRCHWRPRASSDARAKSRRSMAPAHLRKKPRRQRFFGLLRGARYSDRPATPPGHKSARCRAPGR